MNSGVNQMQNKRQSVLFHYLKEKSTTMCYSRKDYKFQKHLCKNTSELLQETNIKKVSVPEAYARSCQLSMMDFFAKIVKEFQPFTISAKTFSSHRMFDRVLIKPLYTLSNSIVLKNCFILSFSIMICPFHMRRRSRNIYIIDRSL